MRASLIRALLDGPRPPRPATGSSQPKRRSRLRLERLERRVLLAAEVGLLAEIDVASHLHDLGDQGGSWDVAASPGLPDHPRFGQGAGGGGGGVPTVLESSGGGSGSGSGSGDEANLRILDAYLRDGQGQRIEAPVIGELVAVQIHYESANLPDDAAYTIEFVVNGVSLQSGTKDFGAGLAQGEWFWWRSGWYAEPETQQVVVTLDPAGTIAEIHEDDNAFSFSFQPVSATFSEPLIWPVGGSPFVETSFTNYVDLDPRTLVRDYAGGTIGYDGHTAWDIGPGNFAAQDAGIAILAAASGVVLEVHDGEYDRNDQWSDPPPRANYVILDHGNGWTTLYYHLRRDSLQVAVGDTVAAGEMLGWMGSSGQSDGPHLHFGLRRHGFVVEPMLDPITYLAVPLPYSGIQKVLLNSGVTNENPTPHIKERPSDVRQFAQRANQTVYVWGYFSGLMQGDSLLYRWRRPDGSVYLQTESTMKQDFGHSWWWWSRRLPPVPELGHWTIDFVVNGETLGHQSFEVTSEGAAEIRVEQEDGRIVLHQRYTPIDFGAVAEGAEPPQQTFRIINHGEQPLELHSMTVPDGYSIVQDLPSMLLPGAEASIIVALATERAGYHAGQIRIFSSDADETATEFSVEGLVEANDGRSSLVLGLSQRRAQEGTRLVGHVRRVGAETNLSAPLTVSLQSSDSEQLSLPPWVEIPAGARSVRFALEPRADNIAEGTQTVSITAASSGFAPARNLVDLEDNLPQRTPPKVESVVVNGGAPQRSMLQRVAIYFDSLIEIDAASPEPVQVQRRESGDAISVQHVHRVEDGKSVVEVTFSEPPSNGNFTLRMDAAAVHANGVFLDGDGDGQEGGDFTFGDQRADAFFSLFGDTDGSETVNLLDFSVFRSVFGTTVDDSGDPAGLDANRDGMINLLDFAAFRRTFGSHRAWAD